MFNKLKSIMFPINPISIGRIEEVSELDWKTISEKDRLLSYPIEKDCFKDLKRGDFIQRKTNTCHFQSLIHVKSPIMNGIRIVSKNDIENSILFCEDINGNVCKIHYSTMNDNGIAVRGSESFQGWFEDFYELLIVKN